MVHWLPQYEGCTNYIYLALQALVAHALPETSNLPSVFVFTECILSGTRQTSSLPSAALKTLGKKNT